jgi:hypothetical protein
MAILNIASLSGMPSSAKLEAGLVEVTTRKARLVFQVVLQQKTGLRLEEGAALCHQLGLRIGDLRAVGDGGTAGERRGAHRRCRMGDAPTRLPCLGLAASSQDLLVAQRLSAALADALGGEDLDHIGTVGDGLPDVLPDLIWGHVRLPDWGDRRQQPRAWNLAARNRVAQRHVARRTDALHGGEARHQHGMGVLRGVKRLLGRCLAKGSGPAVLAEMRADVDMGIDQSGEQGEAGEIIGDRPRVGSLTRAMRDPSMAMTMLRCTPPLPSITVPARIVMGSWAAQCSVVPRSALVAIAAIANRVCMGPPALE